jgi:hypothetical protein
MNIEVKKEVESLSKKAEKADTAGEALHFSQAALNLAHAQATFHNMKK